MRTNPEEACAGTENTGFEGQEISEFKLPGSGLRIRGLLHVSESPKSHDLLLQRVRPACEPLKAQGPG